MSVPQLGYLTSCPKCGAQLQPHVGPGQDAPWLCVGCARGWWCAELTTEARARFRPRYNDFGHGLVPGVTEERDAAVARKHSIPCEMCGLPGVAADLKKFVHHTRRPGSA